MPKHLFALILAPTLLLTGAGCQKSAPQPTATIPSPPQQTATSSMPSTPTTKLYGIETAIIDYVIKGDFLHGKETRTFTDWGRHESVVSEQDGSTQKSITITDETSSYAFGTSDKQGLRSPLDPRMFWHADSGTDYNAFIANRLEENGFEKNGTRTIVGKTCDIWKHVINPMTVCMWNGIPLSTTSFSADGKEQSITEAVRINEQPGIKPETFAVPTDIDFAGGDE